MSMQAMIATAATLLLIALYAALCQVLNPRPLFFVDRVKRLITVVILHAHCYLGKM